MGMTIFDSRDPAFRAAGELTLGLTALVGMFSAGADYIEPAPIVDNRYTAGEVKAILNRTVAKANTQIKAMRDRGEQAAEMVADYQEKVAGFIEEILEGNDELREALNDRDNTIRQLQQEIARLKAR